MILNLGDLEIAEVQQAEAQCLLTGDHRHENWAADYPIEGSLPPAGMLLESLANGTWQQGFAMYQLIVDEQVIGDIGFHGTPADGVAELGYGIVPSARGRGYATRAVIALAEWALAQPGVSRVIARPDHDESRAVLVRAGFREEPDNIWLLT